MIVGSVVKYEGKLDTILEIEGSRIRLKRAGWIESRMMVVVTEPPRPVLEDCMTPLEKEIYSGTYKLVYRQFGDGWCVYDEHGIVLARCSKMEHARLLAWNPLGRVTQLRSMLRAVLKASILVSELAIKAYAFLVIMGELIYEDTTKFKEHGEKATEIRDRFQKYLDELEEFLRG